MIESYSFGTMIVAGRRFNHDLKIIGHRVVADWWRKKGHLVSVDDIRDIIEATPEMIILGTGASGMMQPATGLVDFLNHQRIQMIAVPTEEAAHLFNKLTDEGKNIAAGFHLTC